MKDTLLSLLGSLGLAYWVKITTDSPTCTYYFGPFANELEAKVAQAGYCEDLRGEGAQNIVVAYERRRRPSELTITDDWGGVQELQGNRLTAIAS